MTTIQMNCYYYTILLNNHAFEFLFNSHIECCPYCGSIHIVKAGKTVKEDNVINAIIVNEDSLIVPNHLMHWSHLSKRTMGNLILFFIEQ